MQLLFIQSLLEDHRRDDFMIVRPNGELMVCVDHPTSERLGFNGAKKFMCENGRVLIVVNLKNSLFSNDEISSKVLLNTYFTSSNDARSFVYGELFSQGHNHGICTNFWMLEGK